MLSFHTRDSDRSKLILSIKEGDVDQLRAEMELKQIDVNEEINGRFLLHYAADYGNDEVLRYLFDQNAQVNVEDYNGITPLLSAIYEGNTKCVELLLTMGANYSGPTPDGKTYEDAAEKEEIRQLIESQKVTDQNIRR